MSDRNIQFLSEFLGDPEVRTIGSSDGPVAGFIWHKLAVRDYAAMELAHQLGLDESPEVAWMEKDWAALRAKVERVLVERKSPKDQKGGKK